MRRINHYRVKRPFWDIENLSKHSCKQKGHPCDRTHNNCCPPMKCASSGWATGPGTCEVPKNE